MARETDRDTVCTANHVSGVLRDEPEAHTRELLILATGECVELTGGARLSSVLVTSGDCGERD